MTGGAFRQGFMSYMLASNFKKIYACECFASMYLFITHMPDAHGFTGTGVKDGCGPLGRCLHCTWSSGRTIRALS